VDLNKQGAPDRSLQKNAVKAIALGVALGFFVASFMTFLDWYENPSGIFHGEHGTNWVFVRDTFSSWFAPVAVPASIFALSGVLLFARAKRRK
jgi:hypothetical protein